MASDASRSEIEVVYALPEVADIVAVPYASGITARMAVELSGIMRRHPEAARRPLVLGVFGVRVEDGYLLTPGDRVEIARPLREDPRELRKRLQSDGKVVGGHVRYERRRRDDQS